jgi:hypothetical protein
VDLEVPELAGDAARALVQPPAQDEPGPDARADEDEHHVGQPLRGAEALLAPRRDRQVVRDPNRHADRRAEQLAEGDVAPAEVRRVEDDAGRAEALAGDAHPERRDARWIDRRRRRRLAQRVAHHLDDALGSAVAQGLLVRGDDLAGVGVDHRGARVRPPEIDAERERHRYAPISRMISSTLPRTSRWISSSRALVFASKRRTRRGWVFEARTRPQPSGNTTRTPSTVTAW